MVVDPLDAAVRGTGARGPDAQSGKLRNVDGSSECERVAVGIVRVRGEIGRRNCPSETRVRELDAAIPRLFGARGSAVVIPNRIRAIHIEAGISFRVRIPAAGNSVK